MTELEQFVEDGGEIARQITEETLLLHTSTLVGTTLDARVVVRIQLPNGEIYTANKRITIKLRKGESDEC